MALIVVTVLAGSLSTGDESPQATRTARDPLPAESARTPQAAKKQSQCVTVATEVALAVLNDVIYGGDSVRAIELKYGSRSGYVEVGYLAGSDAIASASLDGIDAAAVTVRRRVLEECRALERPKTEAGRVGPAPSEPSTPDSPRADLNAAQAAEHDAVETTCQADSGSVELVSDGDGSPDPTAWTYAVDGDQADAYSSGVYDGPVSVESCGGQSNGIDIVALHTSVREQAAEGWQVEADYVSCSADPLADQALLDELGAGEVFTCSVYGDDGGPSYAFGTVAEDPPFFEVTLGE